MTQGLSEERLQALIDEAGLALDAEALRAFVDGLAAAPEGRDPAMAARLAAPEAPQAVIEGLLDLARERRVAHETGLVDRDATAARLAALRAELARRGLDGFVVPMADEYQNEFVPPRALRISWLSGFTGSAGLIVVLGEKAAIFVDGRYTLQVRDQVDTTLFEPRHISEQPATDWIAENLPAGGKLGYDPWLVTADGVKRFRDAAAAAKAELVACEGNPLDAVWTDQPPPPLAPIVAHALEFAGEASAEKRERLSAELRDNGLNAAVVTAPDSIAWLLNIRGGDVARTPLPLGFTILRDDAHVDFYVDARKLTPGLESHLGNQVCVLPQEAFAGGLAELKDRKVRVDAGATPSAVVDALEQAGAEVVRGVDPCQLPKACKNDTELNGAGVAHVRDGAAVARFLHWLATDAAAGQIDELSAVDRLAALRGENLHFRDLSFDTISGSGPNGAIVHYRVTVETNRKLAAGELYLVDSGAQYLDGTTDITRTVAIGAPSEEMRDRFTRVLQGHIAIATCRFPEGTTGAQLDVLARHALWQAGLDFDHGTGHGVGSYLGVHEGPQRISKLGLGTALKPGMIVSNEPGYYKTGEYGIRIENLVVVTPAPEIDGAERTMLQFETITRAPLDLNLVAAELLNDAEIAWLNAYHETVRAALGPLVDGKTRAWLDGATRPLSATSTRIDQ